MRFSIPSVQEEEEDAEPVEQEPGEPVETSIVNYSYRRLVIRTADLLERSANQLRDLVDDDLPTYDCDCGATYRVPADAEKHKCPECRTLVIE